MKDTSSVVQGYQIITIHDSGTAILYFFDKA